MTDILEEVLNDQNEEKRLVFFKKLLPVVVILTIIVVIIMVAYNKYKEEQIKDKQKYGDIFVKTIEFGTKEDNKKFAFETLQNLINISSTYRIQELAILEQVVITIAEKDYKQAKNLLEKIINNNNDYSQITIAYATVSWLSLFIDEESPNYQDQEKFLVYLKYFDNEKKAFWATANIIKAIWEIKNNMSDEANKTLRILVTSPNVPDLVKDQAKALLANLENKKSKFE